MTPEEAEQRRIEYYGDIVAVAMGQLHYTRDYAYTADVNDLVAAIVWHNAVPEAVLKHVFGYTEPAALTAPPIGALPLTPERFDSLFPKASANGELA